jgi:osmotically inducible protein OsmC
VKDGDGEMALGSGAWRGGFSFRSRVEEDEPSRSNLEELVAAGHAGCFSMALANRLEQERYDPEEAHTVANCHLEMREGEGPTITRVDLETTVNVADIDESKFQRFARGPRRGVPSRVPLGASKSRPTRRE